MINSKLFKKLMTWILAILIIIPFIILLIDEKTSNNLDITMLDNPMTYMFKAMLDLFEMDNTLYVYNLIAYGFSYIAFINLCMLILEVILVVITMIRNFIEKGGHIAE